jgi:hypothetical protein
MPKRVQLRREKGWRKPEGAVVVARPSVWGNVWRVGDPSPWGNREPLGRAGAVQVYRYMTDGNEIFARMAREELAGRDLACWCPLDQPCHADVLLEIANGDR